MSTSPTSDAVRALFGAVIRAMDTTARSDAGTHLGGWLSEAGFASVDPGARHLAYSGTALARHAPYLAAFLAGMLPALVEMTDEPSASQLEAGLAEIRALPATPGAAFETVIHKAKAVR